MKCTAPAVTGAGLGLAAALIVALPASAQQLWSVEEVTMRPLPPIAAGGVAASPQADDAGGAAGRLTAETATVQVAFDYMRQGMGYLELPLMDGSVIAAENAVFEDRGGGNLMWTGEVPGAGYESVLLTVQDGHLVGWFGEPGGPKHVVHAGPDGRGTLAVETGSTGDWCGVEAAPEASLLDRAAAAARDRPRAVVRSATADSLDILTLYTSGTEAYWRQIGGAAVGVQQLSDYLNMAFRNGAIPATANLIPVRWDPLIGSPPTAQGFHYDDGVGMWHWEFETSPEVDGLRKRHKPDLIHFVPPVRMRGIAGIASLREKKHSDAPAVLTGWSLPSPSVFAHEIGHNLGGDHEPATFRDFEAYQSSAGERGWPWMFGHTDMTSCSEREGWGNNLYCPATIMSYGWDADRDDDPRTWAVTEPFYSSVRHEPNGWTIGVAGTSEVERVFHETVALAAVSGAAPWKAEQVPRRIGARWTGRDTVRVSWSEDLSYAGRVVVDLALVEGANDHYELSWEGGDPLDRWYSSEDNVAPVVRSDGALVGVDVAGLRPGGRYRIAGWAPSRRDPDTRTSPMSLKSEVFHLKARERVSGSPAAATGVGARVTGPDSIRLYWRDNARSETGYEVWYRKWSGGAPDEVWRLHGEPLPAGARYVDVEGLEAEEEIPITEGHGVWRNAWVWVYGESAVRGRYSFVVVAYNDRGWNASEMFELEFMPGPYPEKTASGEKPKCTFWNRSTGVDLDGYQVHACLELPDGARQRAWDYGLEADRSALLYFFGRDNAEILVKVLDGCAINGHRWVFIAPVTDLGFRLMIRTAGPNDDTSDHWYYDYERRAQDLIWDMDGDHGNPKGRTARTVSDTTAFPCTAAEIAAAKASSDERRLARRLPRPDRFDGSGAALGAAAPGAPAAPASLVRLSAGSSTDCDPVDPTLTLRGGYTVSMCYETYDGLVGDALDWGLDSSQSGLMYFFDRDNAEVLIKVLDGCGVNGHRWVFVAPVTDLAFNLRVESPDGAVWTHTNRLGHTADAAADTSAFPCVS